MKHLKKSTKELIFYSLLAAFVLAGLIFLSVNIKPTRPEVATPLLDGNLLTIEATDTSQEYVYCVTTVKDPDTCAWENSREFTLETDGLYFLYFKTIASNIISTPCELNYQKIDYSKLRI